MGMLYGATLWKLILLALFSLSCPITSYGMASGPTTSGEQIPQVEGFELLEGQSMEVCQVCLKAWEAIDAGPLGVGLSGCERNYDSKLGLSDADWTELDPMKHLEILKKVIMFLFPLDPGRGIEGTTYDGDNFPRKIKLELKYERLAVAQAMIDVDNDGRTEPVFKYRQGYCGNPGSAAPLRALIVLTPDQQSIDRKKTDLVMQNDGKNTRFQAGSISSNIYDVFSFNGQGYFDRWDRGLDPDIVTVYQAVGSQVTSMCRFRYGIKIRLDSSGGKP